MNEDILLSEIAHGESKKLECKASLPKDSKKYIKTIVAFANTAGGKLIVGVNDDRQIIGVPEEDIFAVKDAISDSITNSCEPQIVPDIFVTETEGKSIIIAEVYPGANCPYFVKPLGLREGTFIRVGGTTRLADESMLKELQMRGSNLRFDEVANLQIPVLPSAIDKLCQDISEARSSRVSGGQISSQISVKEKDLVNWKVLILKGNEYIATNAFLLLTGDYFDFSKIQCARFKGNDRTVFIDKKEYSGPLYEQIENAYAFILNHINMGVAIDELYREEQYEIPTRSVREMIVNAVTHRNYMLDSSIQVAVYDDRVEVTSPGMLYGSLDIASIKAGRSETRNRTIARVFDKMHLIESWGTGIRRILEDCSHAGLPEPGFSEVGDAFRVEIYRKQVKQLAPDQASTEQVPSKYRASTEQVPFENRTSTESVMEERFKELIEFCTVPRKRSEMQEFIGLTHREHFREAVLNPLLEKGFIKLTIPDKPKSSLQRYIKAE